MNRRRGTYQAPERKPISDNLLTVCLFLFAASVSVIAWVVL